MSLEVKQKIVSALSQFSSSNLFDSSIDLFSVLGYNTQRQQKFDEASYKTFKESFIDSNRSTFNEKKALVENWKEIHLLFQLTKAELLNQGILFDNKQVDNTIIEAYLFFAIELDNNEYTRTHLSEITREINKLFPMPVMILFKMGNKLTLAVINRRLHKKDNSKDVLEKITLIKDIDFANPHRGHIEILFDLSFQQLYNNHQFDSFVALHIAWQKTLDANELNKKFYQELANWYFWAIENVEFPDDIKFHKEKDKDRKIRNSTNVIRLITRLIFTWFLKEKDLVPDELFDEKRIKQIINFQDKTNSTYYKAILQNLFFATLNTPMNADQAGSRKFVNNQHLIHTLYRYERFFTNKEKALQLFENIPFLNGGLFECLDKKTDNDDVVRLDCFSDNSKNEKRLVVPDELFFSDYKILDLNETYQTKNKKYKVRGIINILNAYKFTIHENTPIEEEVALDPELLGKVFENLLASYNPETETTARKQTGSFYTPREIVNYMVDESLLAYFTDYLLKKQIDSIKEDIEEKLKNLLSYTEAPTLFTPLQNRLIVEAISQIKILDPACGSGAFPMGILHKLVYVLGKVDKDNIVWREIQKQKAIAETEEAFNIGNKLEREEKLKDINETFENNNGDYGRKLYLIENSIYGVDLQPIAVQIAKLRFFISLIVDQRTDTKAENIGIRPLPNLETKFVAANSLIGIERSLQGTLRNPEIDVKEKELKQVREKHFTARTPKTKEKYRQLDAKLRHEIAQLLAQDGFGSTTTKMLANWNPYDQNTSAEFFDTEWMFSFKDGFDIVIGNPPFVSYYARRSAKLDTATLRYFQRNYDFITDTKLDGKFNTIMFFIEKGLRLCNKNSTVFYIIDIAFNDVPYRYIRKYLLDKSTINKVITGLSEFENVYSDQILLQFSKSKHISSSTPNVQYYTSFNSEPAFLINQNIWKENKLFDFKPPLKNSLDNILSKMEVHQKLGEIFPSKLIRTCMSLAGHEDEFLAKNNISKENKVILKYIQNAKNLPERYSKLVSPELVVYDEELKDKLNQFYRQDAYNDIRRQPKALGLGSLNSYLNPKIFVRQSADKIIATYTEEKCAANTSFYIINIQNEESVKSNINLKYILGVLNSKILTFYALAKNIIITGQKKQPQMMIKPFKTLPIPIPTEKYINILTTIVDFVLVQKRNENDASFFESLIDSLVYELYFPEEIKSANCEIFKHLEEIERIDKETDTQVKLSIISKEFQRLSVETHPVRKAMHFMNTIEEIAIIEGKKQ